MNIIIEIEAGMVSGIYKQGSAKKPLRVFVVDLDPSKVGDSTKCEEQSIEPLSKASDITRDAFMP